VAASLPWIRLIASSASTPSALTVRRISFSSSDRPSLGAASCIASSSKYSGSTPKVLAIFSTALGLMIPIPWIQRFNCWGVSPIVRASARWLMSCDFSNSMIFSASVITTQVAIS
jgi:hypothetical protein